MGQQQLLLIILGVIVVGVAIAIGISMFKAHAISSKRDVVTNECVSLASEAMGYYRKPTSMGGGGNSFTGWSVPIQLRQTSTGSYEATIYTDSVVIIGTGNEVVTGNDSVKVKTVAYPASYRTQIIN